MDQIVHRTLSPNVKEEKSCIRLLILGMWGTTCAQTDIISSHCKLNCSNLDGVIELGGGILGALCSHSTNILSYGSTHYTSLQCLEWIWILILSIGTPRRGIGWHLLKASEELISQMSSSREVYLHCRMIDEAPFNMYLKAGYHVMKTDTVLILLMLQRRKHLMCKKLPDVRDPLESDEEGTWFEDF